MMFITQKKYSKGEILVHLSNKLSLFKVPKTNVISVYDYNENPSLIFYDIQKNLSDNQSCLAIRSSATTEDLAQQSSAGEFRSKLNVPKNQLAVEESVAWVVDGFKKDGARDLDQLDQIIFQDMVEDVAVAGVVFTKEMGTGAPYFVINYDDVSGLTDVVTSGGGEHANRTLYVFRGAEHKLKSERFSALISAIKELESVLSNNSLDIEFAIDHEMTPHLLQVRPISTSESWDQMLSEQLTSELSSLYSRVDYTFDNLKKKHKLNTVFGQMPDWNPIEVIGSNPNVLAQSLYSHLITDSVWSEARVAMGYTKSSSVQLMYIFGGHPFIDIAASFYSFLPKEVEPKTARILVEAWLERLKNNPEFHDRVEFDVAITCFTFDFDKKMERYSDLDLSANSILDYKKKLKSHTAKLISGTDLKRASQEIERLDQAFKSLGSSPTTMSDLPGLLTLCKELGTIQFAKLARHGFIARSLLNSLVTEKALSERELTRFLRSIKTVASEFVEDLSDASKGMMSESEFMLRYGHLRPGTYNIYSTRYDQMTGLFSRHVDSAGSQEVYRLDAQCAKRIEKLFSSNDFTKLSVEEFFQYAEIAIASRERAKFVFTKVLSLILETISQSARKENISLETVAQMSISEICLNENVSDFRQTVSEIEETIISRKKNYECFKLIKLPQLMFDADNVFISPFFSNKPNFISNKKVIGVPFHLNESDLPKDIEGKIVLIDNADPGFDWIFSYEILGLITKFGGTNSHMAIRCTEFGIASAIGCGQQIFDNLISASLISLDCDNELVEKIR